MIRLLTILLLFAAPFAQADSAADKLTEAGISVFTNAYQAWDGDRFNDAVKQFQRACDLPSATATNFYWLGVAEFHRMLQLQSTPASATNQIAAQAACDAAVEALTTAVKLDDRNAESHALLGTLYGMKIKGSLLRAAWFGPRVQKQCRLALATGANDPRVQYLLGMCQFHTAKNPADWHETLATLLKAEKLFEAEAKVAAGPLEPRWGHDSCLTFIGRTYESLDERSEAAAYYRRALAMHPQDHIARAGLKRVTEESKP